MAPYRQLLRSPELVRTLVGAVTAGLTPEHVTHVDAGAPAAAIDAGLYRNRLDLSDLSEHLTGRQAELWRFLDGLALGNQVLDVPFALTQGSRAARALTRCENDRVHRLRCEEQLRAQIAEYMTMLTEQEQRAEQAERDRDQYERDRDNQLAQNTDPTLTVQGAFTGGGNNDGLYAVGSVSSAIQAAMGNETLSTALSSGAKGPNAAAGVALAGIGFPGSPNPKAPAS